MARLFCIEYRKQQPEASLCQLNISYL